MLVLMQREAEYMEFIIASIMTIVLFAVVRSTCEVPFFPLLSSRQRLLVPLPGVQRYHAASANSTLFPRAQLGFISNWFDFSL